MDFDGWSVRFRCGPSGCLPPVRIRPQGLDGPWASLGLLLPGFQVGGRPAHLPDITTASHGVLRRRDFHPQVGQLASLRLHFPSTLVIGGVFGLPGSSGLAARPSELSRFDSPELPPSNSAGRPEACSSPCLLLRLGPSGRWWKLLASPVPRESVSCGKRFRRLFRSLSLRPSWLLAPLD